MPLSCFISVSLYKWIDSLRHVLQLIPHLLWKGGVATVWSAQPWMGNTKNNNNNNLNGINGPPWKINNLEVFIRKYSLLSCHDVTSVSSLELCLDDQWAHSICRGRLRCSGKLLKKLLGGPFLFFFIENSVRYIFPCIIHWAVEFQRNMKIITVLKSLSEIV